MAQPHCREDIADIALNRHGSERHLRARDDAIRASSKKRVDTIAARTDRRIDLNAAFLAISLKRVNHGQAANDVRDVIQSQVDVYVAVERYCQKGGPAMREAALSLFKDELESLRVRRAEVGSLPWPTAAGHTGGLLVPAFAVHARDDYVALGDIEDLATAVRFSSRWSRVLELIRGDAGGTFCIPAESLMGSSVAVYAAAKRYIFQEDDDDDEVSERTLSVMSVMYSDIVRRATAFLVDHPRLEQIVRHFPTTVPLELHIAHHDDDAMVAAASERVACDSTRRAERLFCDDTWLRHVAPLLPARILGLYIPAAPPARPLATSIRNVAEPHLRAAFENHVCDYARIASVIEQAWAQLAASRGTYSSGSCRYCLVNKHALSCPSQMCRTCCHAQGGQCQHHRQ